MQTIIILKVVDCFELEFEAIVKEPSLLFHNHGPHKMSFFTREPRGGRAIIAKSRVKRKLELQR